MDKSQHSHYQTAKNKLIHGRCSINTLRNEIRKEFKHRMHSLRSKRLDTHRQILKKNTIANLIKVGIGELQAALLSDKEAVALLDGDLVLKMLSEVEDELLREELQLQAEAYERDIQQETQMIVANLLNVCNICETFVEEQSDANVICRNCAKIYFGNMSV